MKIEGAKILVTGGAGYIGSHMALGLLDRGEDVVVLDNLVTGVEAVTMDTKGRVLSDATIAIKDGLIAWIGTAAEAASLPKAGSTIDGRGRIARIVPHDEAARVEYLERDATGRCTEPVIDDDTIGTTIECFSKSLGARRRNE